MVKLKAAVFVAMNTILDQKGPEFKKYLLQQFSPQMRQHFEAPIFNNWIDYDDFSKDFEITAKAFFPESQNGVFDLGKLVAEEMIPSMYRMFLRIPSVPFLFKRLNTLWKFNFNKGRIVVRSKGPKRIEVELHEFPELPRHQLEFFRGSLYAMAVMTRVKEPKILPDYSYHAIWKWMVTWK